MPEYIERETLYKHLEKTITVHEATINGSTNLVYVSDHVLHEIRNAPVANVTEVVRCKECKYKTQLMGKAPFAFYACSHNKGLGDNVRESDYCSYGIRKEGAEG